MAPFLIKFSAALVFFVVCSADVPEWPIDDVCMGCICQASSGCNLNKRCEKNACGLFRITQLYWLDAGKPKVRGEPESSSDYTAYQTCTLDPHCAALTVQEYIRKFSQDCNGDGKVDCLDYMAIHKLGGYMCTGNMSFAYVNVFNQCIALVTGV